ncbi:hypothetical protein JVT61DRAFT_5752 [Boletus reticuloceps]|uniref:GST N-terminal domain-containing protein n=1 Tax=Boletus reticuloceps TaxID=495285 RepID=A0A8I2Z0U5_9AGAM|nr:hypothetical protein JVT61DRAFT_5752 [Boletus reticuloceps]
MSKAVLFTHSHSVWASVPELAIRELGYGPNDIESKVINLVQGENFAPTFLDINPKGTLPTMVVDGRPYTSTAEVTSYLVKHAPKATQPRTAFTAKIHEDTLDPNFAMLLANSSTRQQRSHCTLPAIDKMHLNTTLPSQTLLNTSHSTIQSLPTTGALLSIYQGTATDRDKQAFFQRSTVHWHNLSKFVSEELPALLPDTAFFGGDEPGEDDFHLAAWLARIAFVAGGGSEQDGIRALEKGLGMKLHPKVSAYWGAWNARKSWKEVYAQGLH